MKDRINVRCCCQPQKILGTLPAPPAGTRSRRFRAGDNVIELSITKFGHRPQFTEEFLNDVEPAILSQLVAEAHAQDEYAYKAEGLTVEELKRIPGFEP